MVRCELEPHPGLQAPHPLTAPPTVSVIVPVRDRWSDLSRCLEALTPQVGSLSGELIVVDDGSRTHQPPHIEADASVRILRQEPGGRSAARNAGIDATVGDLIVFVDSDVVVAEGFVDALQRAATRHPGDVAFQARLRSRRSTWVWRIEDVRLGSLQPTVMTPDGHIGYFNTAAVAVRRSYACADGDLFDPDAVRGEDTLVLARMHRDGLLPRFVRDAEAVHLPTGSLTRYLTRHFEIGYLTGHARAELSASRGLLDSSGRWSTLRGLVQRSRRDEGGFRLLALVGLAYTIEVAGRSAWLLRSGLRDRLTDR